MGKFYDAKVSVYWYADKGEFVAFNAVRPGFEPVYPAGCIESAAVLPEGRYVLTDGVWVLDTVTPFYKSWWHPRAPKLAARAKAVTFSRQLREAIRARVADGEVSRATITMMAIEMNPEKTRFSRDRLVTRALHGMTKKQEIVRTRRGRNTYFSAPKLT